MSYDNLMITKVDEVREELNKIDYEHKIKASATVIPLSDEETKRKYMELLKILPEIPGITTEEIKLLTSEITNKINKIGVYVHPDYNDEVLCTEEDFRKAIDKVHYEHRYGVKGMNTSLTVGEATKDYNTILEVLMKSNLPDEVKNTLRKEIIVMIGQIPKAEGEKAEERRIHNEQVEDAFLKAKTRFKELSVFKRVKLRLEGKSPELIDRSFMEVEDINHLYRK